MIKYRYLTSGDKNPASNDSGRITFNVGNKELIRFEMLRSITKANKNSANFKLSTFHSPNKRVNRNRGQTEKYTIAKTGINGKIESIGNASI
ncbi:MAG: hypothetical protein OZ913_09780 [Ignavibacteriaceae bacterium]|jgi:hypothetical protein|nr:hypothetical protein [Ignavibacteriaceae bacterium]